MTNNSSGFTLIEFLVATVILMFGLLGMLQGINLAMEKNTETVLRNEAISLADNIMMDQRGLAFAAIATKSGDYYPRKVRGIQKSYSASVTVTTPTVNTKNIDVTVTWKFKNSSKSHQVSSPVSQIQ